MTLRAWPDATSVAPPECAWHAYDDSTFDGAPDAALQIVGYGATPEAALADYAAQLDEIGR